MSYTKRYILNLQPTDATCYQAAISIKQKHQDAIEVVVGPKCLEDVEKSALLTIIGHGDSKAEVIQSSFNALTNYSPGVHAVASSSSEPVSHTLSGSFLAMLLEDDFGLKAVEMITLVSCGAGGSVENEAGFASCFHHALGTRGIFTSVNARTGNTIVGNDGLQWVANMYNKYTRDHGTKRIFSWKGEGEKRLQVSTLDCAGYKGAKRIKDIWGEGSDTDSTPSSSSHDSGSARYTFEGKRPKVKKFDC